MKKIFITGERGIGKSTLIKKLWNFLIETFPSREITGFFTKIEKNEKDKRVLTFISIDSKEHLILAQSNGEGMFVEEGAFEKAAGLLKNIKSDGKILIIDELGYLESESIKFQTEVLELISHASLSILVVRKMKTPFLDHIRSLDNNILIETTQENRENLVETIKDHILQNYRNL
jgi:nucleoside-triphosphatase